MPHFFKRFHTIHGPLNFYFNRMDSGVSSRYHVSVVDPERGVISFFVEKMAGKWVIVEPATVPEWIFKMEHHITGAISEHLGS